MVTAPQAASGTGAMLTRYLPTTPFLRRVQLTPKRIEALEGHFILQIALGGSHVIFLTSTGAMLSCGVCRASQARPPAQQNSDWTVK